MYSNDELFSLLEEKVKQYNHPGFIETDPIQIPRQFSNKENIEIAGFLSATIAWGQRPTIIKNANRLMQGMDNNPAGFLKNSTETDWSHLSGFKHRTFNSSDLFFNIFFIQHIYKNHGGLEQVFTTGFQTDETIFSALAYFRTVFFEINSPPRTQKHVSDVTRNSSAKRLNMFLRWMVRNDNAVEINPQLSFDASIGRSYRKCIARTWAPTTHTKRLESSCGNHRSTEKIRSSRPGKVRLRFVWNGNI